MIRACAWASSLLRLSGTAAIVSQNYFFFTDGFLGRLAFDKDFSVVASTTAGASTIGSVGFFPGSFLGCGFGLGIFHHARDSRLCPFDKTKARFLSEPSFLLQSSRWFYYSFTMFPECLYSFPSGSPKHVFTICHSRHPCLRGNPLVVPPASPSD